VAGVPLRSPSIEKTFGALLREYRLAAGFSQEFLAEKAGISAESVGALERGVRRAPWDETIELLAEALELAPAQRELLTEAASRARARASRKPPGRPATPERQLPLQSTSFLGRAREVAAISELVGAHRLVTITGPGGIGKSRTAIEVANQLPIDRWDRIHFVDLSSHSDGTFIANAIATAIDPAVSDRNVAIDGIVSALRDSRTLIILDTCEHLLAEVSVVVVALLAACENVTFMATSRERLAIYGEAIYRLPPLEGPSRTAGGANAPRESPAVELFIARATTVDHALTFSDADEEHIVAICDRLDGIPLAIELASARVSALGLRALRTRIERGLVMTSGPRNLPLRQQTMLATMSWSYGLLNDVERLLLQRLSVFVGGFTLAAAESVCSRDGIETDAVADVLASLFEKSLVGVSPGALHRYRLLDSVRSFAAAKLAETNQSAALARRHAQWLAEFGDGIDERRVAMTEAALRSETLPELENARVALEWALDSGPDEGVLLAGRIVGGLRTLWLTSGRRAECKGWASRVIERLDEERHPQVAAKVLKALIQSTHGATMHGFIDRAIPVFERIGDRSGLALLQCHVAYRCQRSDRFEEGDAAIRRAGELLSGYEKMWPAPYSTYLLQRSRLNMLQGRFDLVRADIKKGIQINTALGDDDLARWHFLAAELDCVIGNPEAAVAAAESMLAQALRRRELHSGLTQAYNLLALLRAVAGDLEGAHDAAREVLRLAGTSERVTDILLVDISVSDVVLVFALGAASESNARPAANMLGAADAARGRAAWMTDAGGHSVDRMVRRRLVAALLHQLSDAELQQAWHEGSKASLEQLAVQASAR
jgi:predicted ATPase/transcriptional regulator with XRE-family HTH domain